MRATTTHSNPFSTRFTRPGAIPYLFSGSDSVESLVKRLAANGWRGQIIGPHGCGKSTLLAGLLIGLERVGRKPRVFALHDGQRSLGVALRSIESDVELIVVDGYEQLGRWQRWRLAQHCRRRNLGLLVTAHSDVGLPTLFEARPRLETLLAVVARLLPREQWPFSQEEVAQIFARERQDLRETLFSLYDVYQTRSIPTT